MTDILITEQITGQPIDGLKREFEITNEPDLWQRPEMLGSKLAEARAVIVRNQTKITAELIQGAGQLQVIGRAGAGLDNIDVEAACEAGVVVAYTPEQNALSVAELTLGMMLDLARHTPVADRDTKQGNWARQAFTGSELYGKTLGLLGLGRIGFLVAMRCRAMGMNVLAHDRFVSPDSPMVVESRADLVELEAMLGQADYVSCHLPANAQTRGFVNRRCFDQMKSSAYFLNLSRGEVVDEPALVEALEQKAIAGAALDVRAQEPPGASPLNEMDHVILTPHIAAFTDEAQQRVVRSICHDVAAVLRGESAMNFRNFPRPGR